MSMRDLLCELKLPAVIISVVTIVWCTALRSGADQNAYYPPDAEYVRLQKEAKEADVEAAATMDDDGTVVRLELNP